MDMRFNKIFLYILFIFCSTINIFAQPRVNGSRHYSVISSGTLVNSPIGWYYDDSKEKWIGYYGGICGEYHTNPTTPKRMTADRWSAFGDEGIFSLQVKKVKAGDKIYYLLYHTYWEGEYDYPAIERGWRYWKDTKVYIIEESEYQKVLNLEVGINKIHIVDYVISYLDGLNKGQTAINENLNSTFKEILSATEGKPYKSYWSDYVIYMKLEEDGKTVRFHLPSNKILWSDAIKVNEQNAIDRVEHPYTWYKDYSKYDCVDFGESYFELTPLQFSNLKIK